LAARLPLEVHHGSRALLVLSGILLIALGRGLGRGKRRAWQLAIVVSASLMLHLVRNVHLVFVVPSLVLLGYLTLARRSFIAGSDPAATRRSLLLAPAFVVAILVFGTLGQLHYRHAIDPPFQFQHAVRATVLAAVLSDDPGVIPHSPHAEEFLDSIAWLSVGSGLVLVWLLLRPVIARRLDPSLPAAQAIIRDYGDHSLATFAAESDKYHFLAMNGRATIAYRVSAHVAITIGDPIGSPETLEPAVDEFLANCRRHDWVPCFFEVTATNLKIYRQRKLRTLKIAEEAVIPLTDFTLRGSRMQKLRQSLNKVERENPNLHIEVFSGTLPAEIEDQLHLISEHWLARKGLPELGFTMGRFDPAALAGHTLVAALDEQRVVGSVSWRPFAGGGFTIDLMRYGPDAPKFLMDYLIAQSLLHFQKNGTPKVSLANAPLANISPQDEFTLLDRGVKLLFENVRGIYEYKFLF